MNSDAHLIANELLEMESRRRRQVPIAVFTVLAAHVVLFMGLLGSAGCKQQASITPVTEQTNRKYQNAFTPSEEAAREAAKPVVPAVVEPAVVKPAAKAPLPSQPVKPQKDRLATADPGAKVHTVKAGDSLGKIAKVYGTTPRALKEANNLKSDLIRVGQKLKIG